MDPIKYFNYFKYVPTQDEFLLFSKGILPTGSLPGERVVTAANKMFLARTLRRQKISRQKIKQRALIIKLLGNLPWVKFIGLSGSVSMQNAHVKDDIDLFVITAKNRLWTARFLLVCITTILGIKRQFGEKFASNKLCFNLFFSEANLRVPQFKRTVYVAHEVLQLKPLVNKNQTYERFLWANKWIISLFPNAKQLIPTTRFPKANSELAFGLVEQALRKLQLWLIKRHQTTEIITETQLWFFPDDFEKKLKILYP